MNQEFILAKWKKKQHHLDVCGDSSRLGAGWRGIYAMLPRDPFYRKPIDILSFDPDPGPSWPSCASLMEQYLEVLYRNIIVKAADDVFKIAMFPYWYVRSDGQEWYWVNNGKHALGANQLVQLRSLDVKSERI